MRRSAIHVGWESRAFRFGSAKGVNVGTSVNRVGRLIDADQNREPASQIGSLVSEHGTDLMRRALFLTRTTDDAWDLYHDTLERALRRHSSRIPGDKIRNWLHIIMHNLFVDRWRAPASRARRSLTDALIERLAAEEPAVEAWWWSLGQKDVELAIARLPRRLHEVFSLHLQGRSYTKIATALAIPLNTVASRLRRARQRVRDLLVRSAGQDQRKSVASDSA